MAGEGAGRSRSSSAGCGRRSTPRRCGQVRRPRTGAPYEEYYELRGVHFVGMILLRHRAGCELGDVRRRRSPSEYWTIAEYAEQSYQRPSVRPTRKTYAGIGRLRCHATSSATTRTSTCGILYGRHGCIYGSGSHGAGKLECTPASEEYEPTAVLPGTGRRQELRRPTTRYVLTEGRIPYFHHGTLRNNPYIREIYPCARGVDQPRVRRASIGIENGDWVNVKSPRTDGWTCSRPGPAKS